MGDLAGIIDVLDQTLGKAYTTRVGEGPFPTEQDNEIGRLIGERGHEFGTVTGRPRRCGWFDAVLVRQTVRTSGINGIALTKRRSGFDRGRQASDAPARRPGADQGPRVRPVRRCATSAPASRCRVDLIVRVRSAR